MRRYIGPEDERLSPQLCGTSRQLYLPCHGFDLLTGWFSFAYFQFGLGPCCLNVLIDLPPQTRQTQLSFYGNQSFVFTRQAVSFLRRRDNCFDFSCCLDQLIQLQRLTGLAQSIPQPVCHGNKEPETISFEVGRLYV
jgi:hypothetical protein